MSYDPKAAAEKRRYEREAELRYRYIVRHENEPRIRQLEQILGLPESGK